MTPEQKPSGRADARRLAKSTGLVRHKGHSRWREFWAPLLKVVAITLAVALVSGASVAAIAVNQFAGKVADNSVDISNGKKPPKTAKAASFEGGFNVLVAGVDNSTAQGDSFGERDATLNDVNILLHVSADHKSAVVVSIPRDLVVAQPECTDPTTGDVAAAVDAEAVNGSYARGGLGCVVSTVSELTGLDIPYAGLISFEGTVAMADAVGGVPICLNDAIEDPASGLNLPAGTSVVAGQTALSYLRSRHGVGDGSDLSRISSQQAYMSSLMRVMKSNSTLTDVSKITGLANAAGTNLKLSTSLANIPTMVSMALALKDIDLDKLVFVQYPTVEDPDDVAKLVPAADLATALFAKVAADQSFTLDENSLGNSAEADPAAPAPAEEPVPAETTDPAATDPAAVPAPAAPETLAGLRGQTANQQTCSIAYDY